MERGLGLDEDTAVVCEDWGGECEVMGGGGVWLLDLSTATTNSNLHWTCRGAATSYLTLGDKLDLQSWTVRCADWKTELARDGGPPQRTDDVFGPAGQYGLVVESLLASLSNTSTGSTRQSSPLQYQLRFHRSQHTKAVSGARPDTGSLVISYQDLLVDFTWQ